MGQVCRVVRVTAWIHRFDQPTGEPWRAEVCAALADVEVLALPALAGPPPAADDDAGFRSPC